MARPQAHLHAAGHAPLVPRQRDIQPGYELPCSRLRLADSEVRLFTFPTGAGPEAAHTVVCIPGLGASGRSFAQQRPLAERHQLLLWTPPFSTPAHATPLEHNLGLLAHPQAPLPKRFFLLGSSYGSLLALAFALRYRDRLSGLILANPVISSRRIRHGAVFASSLLRVPLPFAYLFAPTVARVLGGRELSPEGRAEIVREARRLSPLEMVRRLRDILHSRFLSQLESFEVPTLIIHGRRDRIVPVSAARDVAERLPHGRLEVMPTAGHLPYMTHPEWFNAVLSSFLDEEGLRAGRQAQ